MNSSIYLPTVEHPRVRLAPRPVHIAAPTSSRTGWYGVLAMVVMTLGTIVMIEPAPVDIAVMGMLILGLLLRRLKFVSGHELPFCLLAGFAVANLLSLLNAWNMPAAYRYLGITFYLLLTWVFFAGTISWGGYPMLRRLMNGYVVGGILAVIAAMLSYLRIIGHQDVLLMYGRPKGLFKDPNVFGPYLVPMLMYALMRLQGRTRGTLEKAYWLSASVIAAVGIFFAFSRGCWINAVVTLGAYFLIQLATGQWTRRQAMAALRTAFALILMVGAVFAVAAIDPRIDRMLFLRIGNEGVQEYDTNQRFYTQRRAIEAVERHPLGIGPGHAELDFDNVATHSVYLRVLSENGVAGFLALYALVGLSLLRAFRMSATLPNAQWRAMFTIVGACCLGMLVNGIVIDAIHWRHLWLLLALAWVSHPSMYRAEASAERQPALRTAVIPGPRHENRLYRHSRG